ncbi:unnamed protein product [Anisakis simplex]|uniref:Metalloendopeptidase n=1 Tax=Anisakis simplex TaxID=6269 RepID=A0A158PPR0_ANISI|nr:unnamed protein product [Anisakis simplex]
MVVQLGGENDGYQNLIIETLLKLGSYGCSWCVPSKVSSTPNEHENLVEFRLKPTVSITVLSNTTDHQHLSLLVNVLVTVAQYYSLTQRCTCSWRKFLTPDDFIRAQETPVKKPTDREIEAIQNYGLFEGDIEGIDDPQMAFMHDQYDDSYYGDIFRLPFHSALNLATYPEKIWPEGIIPYEIEETMSKDERAAIAQAFDEYKQKTCIRFVPKTAYDFDFIYIKTNFASGCSSYVGRSGGNQTVSLEVGKCFTKGIIAHELMHALGFFHEHSRTDRDQFVEILEDNIRPG